jgi:hypothetical protein
VEQIIEDIKIFLTFLSSTLFNYTCVKEKMVEMKIPESSYTERDEVLLYPVTSFIFEIKVNHNLNMQEIGLRNS